MLRESLYFSFANRKSIDFGIYNVGISDGLFEEQISYNKTINEKRVRGNDKPYFIDITREPKQFQLRFAFDDTFNDDLIDEILRWLNVDFYQPLFFSENIDRVFYAMPIDNINLIHNGLKNGYVNLNMRCDSPYSYSHYKTTHWYDFSSNLQDKIIQINNKGHFSIKPEIWINKIGDGDIEIINYSNGLETFKLTGLKDQEEIYVDCENEIIETNLPNTYRYDNFNDSYLELVYGKNTLKVVGEAKIKFQYRYIYQ